MDGQIFLTQMPAATSGETAEAMPIRYLQKLIATFASQNRFDVSIAICEQTIEQLEEEKGHDHPQVAVFLTLLALIYLDKGMYSEARCLLQDVLAIRKVRHGRQHPKVVLILNHLARLHGKLSDFEKGEACCAEALDISQLMHGTNEHSDVAKLLNNLGFLCLKQCKYTDSEAHYRQALRIYETLYGDSHLNVFMTKNYLANLLLLLGRSREAELLLKEVLSRAHECEFAADDGGSRSAGPTIWQLAEYMQTQKCLPDTARCAILRQAA